MARRKSGREIHGLLLLDKAVGITSNAALQAVKRLYQAKKAGHTGSLDPLASGVLPVCLGEATKISSFLLNTDKRYRVTIQLGVVTDTGDAEGRVIERHPVPVLTQQAVEAVLIRFTGEISQVPPMYSALKHNGERLYDLARKGVVVERDSRRVTIHELSLAGFTESALDLEVHCSKGTYIRTLAEEIGRALGCGGSVSRLRRTAVGALEIGGSFTFERLKEMAGDADRLACLLPVDAALASLPGIKLNEDLVYFIRRGQAVFVPKAPLQGRVRIYDERGMFLGIGEMLDNGKVGPRRMLSVAATPESPGVSV